MSIATASFLEQTARKTTERLDLENKKQKGSKNHVEKKQYFASPGSPSTKNPPPAVTTAVTTVTCDL